MEAQKINLTLRSSGLRKSAQPLSFTLGVMLIVKSFLKKFEERPPWLRWLETAPSAVREAESLARRVYLVYQLPCAIVVACVYAGGRQLGWLAASSLVGLWLLMLGITALIWPLYIARLAFAAYRNIGISTGSMAWRLRALAIVAFVLAGLLCIVLIGMVVLLMVVTVTMSKQALL